MSRVIASLFLVACAFAGDPEWPGFRGPSSNPVAINSNLPDKWSKTSNIEWTATLPGLGWSSPIVAGRNVFLTTVTTDGKAKQPQVGTNYSNDYVAELSKQGLKDKEVLDRLNARDFELPNEVTVHYFLYSIDLYSGKINWTREFQSGHPPGGRHRKNSFCSETPVTDGNRVYVYINNLGLFAYDLDGNKVWNTPLENFPTILDFGTASSPTLVHDLVIIVNDNEKQQSIAAFDKNTGKQARHSIRIPVSKSGAEIVLSTSKAPIARQAGRAPTSGKTPGVPKSSPLALASPSVTISRANNCGALAGCPPCPSRVLSPTTAFCISTVGPLKPSPRSNPARAATSAHRTAPNSTISLPGFSPKPALICRPNWPMTEGFMSSPTTASSRVLTLRLACTSSPWGYNGEIYCMNEEGRTFVIRAGDKYELLDSNDLGEMALATPALIGDRLILRTENHLYSIRNTPSNRRR